MQTLSNIRNCRVVCVSYAENEATFTFNYWEQSNSTVVCNQQILLTFTFIHFGKPPHHKGEKNPYYCLIRCSFLNLAWSRSQYICYKPTCINTHFKNFGPGKTLPFSKYTTKIRCPQLLVWDTTTTCA